MSNKTKRGFTLVELLATLAILSIVLSIVVFTSTGIINNTREKSYETTINNVLVAGGNYTVENPELSVWIEDNNNCLSGSNCEYQCISINELISNGYFKGDILESEVEKNVTIQDNNFVYIERNVDNKTITNKVFEYKVSNDNKCAVSAYGNIAFNVNPSTWAREKSVTITYILNSSQDISTKASYEFTGENGQKLQNNNITFNSARVNTVTVNGIKENGTLIAKIGNGETKTLYISTIDRGTPTITKYESKHNLANNQTVSITLSDTASGIKGYYFGKENPATSTVTYEAVANLKEVNLTKEVDSKGTWYLRTVDAAGNYSETKSLVFYETKYIVDNKATIAPIRMLDVNDSVYVEFPKVISSNDYTLEGWYDNSSYDGDAISEYKVNGDRTLYGNLIKNKFSSCDVTIVGEAKYGKTLTAKISNVQLTGSVIPKYVTYTYIWYSSDGKELKRESTTKLLGTSTYKITDTSLVGKTLYVKVLLEKENYETGEFTSSHTAKIPKINGYINLGSSSGEVNVGATNHEVKISSHHGGALNVVSDNNVVKCTISDGSTNSNAKIVLSNLNKVSAKTIKVTVTSDETSIYNAASATYTLTISDKNAGYINLSSYSGDIYAGTDEISFSVVSHHGGNLTVNSNSSYASAYVSGSTVYVSNLSSLSSGNIISITVTSGETSNYKQASATYYLEVLEKNPGYLNVSFTSIGSTSQRFNLLPSTNNCKSAVGLNVNVMNSLTFSVSHSGSSLNVYSSTGTSYSKSGNVITLQNLSQGWDSSVYTNSVTITSPGNSSYYAAQMTIDIISFGLGTNGSFGMCNIGNIMSAVTRCPGLGMSVSDFEDIYAEKVNDGYKCFEPLSINGANNGPFYVFGGYCPNHMNYVQGHLICYK